MIWHGWLFIWGTEDVMINNYFPHFRVGQGYDVHQLVDNRPLILGGVVVPYPLGLLGHSDADVLLHALIDGLLGGVGLGDIGRHFPDTDPIFLGANSRQLLREVVKKVHDSGFLVGNMDATIIAESPKLSPYISLMQENIAKDLEVTDNQINIKAKTNERLGYLGRKEAIAAQVVVLLYRK